jgi:hypothetical protein
MLYNPHWNDISLASLIAWLETKPADEGYCYTSTGGCLLAQFLMSKGYCDLCVGSCECYYNVYQEPIALHLPPEFYDISHSHPRTFGAALSRAKAVT